MCSRQSAAFHDSADTISGLSREGARATEAAGVFQERINRKGDRDDGGFKHIAPYSW